MINALCFDLEPWYTAELVKRKLSAAEVLSLSERDEEQVAASVMPILDLLDIHKAKATFAVVGVLAEKHPALVKTIYDRGHEIASHSYYHSRLHDLGEEGFDEDTRRCVALLQSITGEKPVGFRAPTASVDNSTKWAFAILKK